MPTPIVTEDFVRLFFSSRDLQSRSHIYYADLDLDDLGVVKNTGQTGLKLGKPGSFDDSGVMPSSISKVNDEIFLYYIGWNKSDVVPYRLAIGLAKMDGNLSIFEKYSEGPIIDRSTSNPFFVTTPNVTQNGSDYEMLYSKGYEWQLENEQMESNYLVSRAESSDGVSWKNFKNLDLPNSKNACIARPVQFNDHIIYSKRPSLNFRQKENGYRVIFAKPTGLDSYEECKIEWTCDYPVGKDVSYAYPIQVAGVQFLFFNGENFGKYGIYVAKIEGLDHW